MTAAVAYIAALVFVATVYAACLVLRAVIHNTQMLGDRSDKLSDSSGEVPFHSSDLDQGAQANHDA